MEYTHVRFERIEDILRESRYSVESADGKKLLGKTEGRSFMSEELYVSVEEMEEITAFLKRI